MCRSIKKLHHTESTVSEQEIQEAALQFVRKVSGYRKPSKKNEVCFNEAVDEVGQVVRKLLSDLATS